MKSYIEYDKRDNHNGYIGDESHAVSFRLAGNLFFTCCFVACIIADDT